MGVRNFVKNTVKSNTNVTGWASWNAIKQNGKTIGNLIKDIKNPDQNASRTQKTFEDAMKEYGLTEKDISSRMKLHYQVAVGCAALGVGALGWAFYLLAKLMFLSGLVGLALSALMFAYAFREHFAYFQLKRRRLGGTFKEWFSALTATIKKKK